MSTGILHSTASSVENGATWEVWFKKNSEGYTSSVILSKSGVFELRDISNDLVCDITTTALSTIDSTFNISLGVKYHIAATYDGVNVKIYVNGNLVKAQAKTGALSYNDNPYKLNSTDSIENNISNGGNHTFYAFRIYSRALTGAEVRNNYNKQKVILGYTDIVSDGLVMHLDAGISDSYPGSGTT
jgi:hypothetical protein